MVDGIIEYQDRVLLTTSSPDPYRRDHHEDFLVQFNVLEQNPGSPPEALIEGVR